MDDRIKQVRAKLSEGDTRFDNIGLIRARRLARFTLVQLFTITGIPATTLSKYESGKTQPPYEKIKKIAEALNVSIDALIKTNRH